MNRRGAHTIFRAVRKTKSTRDLTYASSDHPFQDLGASPISPVSPLLQQQRNIATFGFPFQRPLSTKPQVATMQSSTLVTGKSGRIYKIEETLQDKGGPFGHVYLASDGEHRVILKEIPTNLQMRKRLYEVMAECPHIRLPIDIIPDKSIFVFEYLNDHLLNLGQKDLPLEKTKRILREALVGLASLHDLRISHNDIKANNILVQTKYSSSGTDIEKVQIIDLEDAVQLKPGHALKGSPLGNYMWRSPEAHAGGPMELASDIFSYGIVCIYAVTGVLIFAVNDTTMSNDDKLGTVYFKQMSYFADGDGTRGLLEYLGKDNEVREVFEAVEEACQDVPKTPFRDLEVPALDSDFKDLIIKMTKLDPRERITAREALAHKWFRDS